MQKSCSDADSNRTIFDDPFEKKNGGNLNMDWVFGYHEELLIWTSMTRGLCCLKKKSKVIPLEMWIEFTGEIT